jgi:hypothetical protein
MIDTNDMPMNTSRREAVTPESDDDDEGKERKSVKENTTHRRVQQAFDKFSGGTGISLAGGIGEMRTTRCM